MNSQFLLMAILMSRGIKSGMLSNSSWLISRTFINPLLLFCLFWANTVKKGVSQLPKQYIGSSQVIQGWTLGSADQSRGTAYLPG